MKLKLLLFVISVGWALPTLAQPSVDQLLKACRQKTLVTATTAAGDTVVVGKKPDGWCSGFLEGAFTTLLHKGLICPPVDDPDSRTADFLISIVDTYHADHPSETEVGALVEQAFSRAFACKSAP